MTKHQRNWLLAVATKRAYPIPETGDADPATAAAPPPTFEVIADQKRPVIAAISGAIGFVLGIGAAYLAFRPRRAHG